MYKFIYFGLIIILLYLNQLSIINGQALFRVCNLFPSSSSNKVAVQVSTNPPTAPLQYLECANSTNLLLQNHQGGDIINITYNYNNQGFQDGGKFLISPTDAENLIFIIADSNDLTSQTPRLHFPRLSNTQVINNNAARFLFINYGIQLPSTIQVFFNDSQGNLIIPSTQENYTELTSIDIVPSNNPSAISTVNFVLSSANSTNVIDILANEYIDNTFVPGPATLQVVALVGQGNQNYPYQIYLLGPQRTNSTLRTSLLFCNLFATGSGQPTSLSVFNNNAQIQQTVTSSILSYKQCERLNNILMPIITSPYTLIPITLNANQVTISYPLHPFEAQNIVFATATAQSGNTMYLTSTNIPEVNSVRSNIKTNQYRFLYVNLITLGANTLPLTIDFSYNSQSIATGIQYNQLPTPNNIVTLPLTFPITISAVQQGGSSLNSISLTQEMLNTGGNAILVAAIGGGSQQRELFIQSTNITRTVNAYINTGSSSSSTGMNINTSSGTNNNVGTSTGNNMNTVSTSTSPTSSTSSTGNQNSKSAAESIQYLINKYVLLLCLLVIFYI